MEKDKLFFTVLFWMVGLTFLFSLFSLGKCIVEVSSIGFMESSYLHGLLGYRIFMTSLLLAASIFVFKYAKAYGEEVKRKIK